MNATKETYQLPRRILPSFHILNFQGLSVSLEDSDNLGPIWSLWYHFLA